MAVRSRTFTSIEQPNLRRTPMTSKSASTARGTKYVYSFGGGTAEGDGSQKNLLGGKGANLAEMARIGLPVPPGFTITTEVCTLLLRERPELPEGPREGRRAAPRRRREEARQEVRRPEEPAPRLGPLRRPRLDAGDDGHDPQPRPERRDGRGARGGVGQPALRLGLLPPLRRDVRRRRPRPQAGRQARARPVRGDPRGEEGEVRRPARHRAPGRRR